MIRVLIDGGCRPTNPGEYAVWAYQIDSGGSTTEDSGVDPGLHTNNSAEFVALIKALIRLLKWSKSEIVIGSDSLLLVSVMNKRYAPARGRYIPYMKIAKRIAELFSNLSFYHAAGEEVRAVHTITTQAWERR